MGKVSSQKSVLEAQANIGKTWEELFAHPKVTDPNLPLYTFFGIPDCLHDAESPVVAVILFIYQMNNFCFKELNRSSRFKDQSKVNTLGPWAAALYEIVLGA